MTAPECPRERDVINAIVTGRWPHQCDETLPAHVVECSACKEIVDVAGVFRLERDELLADASLPSAGQVWWRAAIRAKLEASEQAARPLSWLFGVSVACVVGLAIAVVELLWSPLQRVLTSASAVTWTQPFGLGEAVRLLPSLTDLAPLTSTGALVVLGATACLVLAPLVLYFALSDE